MRGVDELKTINDASGGQNVTFVPVASYVLTDVTNSPSNY
jgi:hypothetical protein